MDMHSEKPPRVTPRIIIHGGAGNISRENLPAESYKQYRAAMLEILQKAHAKLQDDPHATALDVSTYAVSLLENCPLFNAGRGAVYTTAGTHELEASVMVSRGLRKRGVGVMKVTRVRNPILLAREMLLRGEVADGGGAQGHCQLEGETCDRLAQEWGLERVLPSYFWTKRSWDQHRKGLGLDDSQEAYDEAKRKIDEGLDAATATQNEDYLTVGTAAARDISWDGKEYIPQGTVGAVVLDSFGVVAVATSTGGITNKLPGRIGDTPTIGAGFFADEWTLPSRHSTVSPSPTSPLSQLTSLISDCLPSLSAYAPLSHSAESYASSIPQTRAVAMSGTGNGDSFLRTAAVRTAAAMAQWATPASSLSTHHHHDQMLSLQAAVTAVAGPNGVLQRSAGDRWKKTGEGEGGIIGIEVVRGKGTVSYDFNSGGLLRAWVDDEGKKRMMVFREEF